MVCIVPSRQHVTENCQSLSAAAAAAAGQAESAMQRDDASDNVKYTSALKRDTSLTTIDRRHARAQ